MILAENKIIPPKEWIHDIKIKNNDNKDIITIMKQNMLPISSYWYITSFN